MKMTKTREQLVSMLKYMKQGNNNNAIKHIKYEDIDAICNYLLEAKKIVYKKGNDGTRWFFCPTCNKIIPKTANCVDQYRYPYCPYCGQKLDWSEYFGD